MITRAKVAFPARPKTLVKKARTKAQKQLSTIRKVGLPTAQNPVYIKWLQQESMLTAANKLARKYSGTGAMWQNPYAKPRPRMAVKKASVWYTAYPMSHITRENESMINALGSEKLWSAFEAIGIKGIHTGPLKLAGGMNGWKYTPSIDGHFDRISQNIDPIFGDEDDFRRMASVVAKHGAIVIDDIVPAHTGKGADFRLAEMGQGEYPGIYHMVEIYKKDWDILPPIATGKDSANLSPEVERELKKRGYIIGQLQRVIFYEPGVKETNWSVTKPVRGVDGIVRRWVYLHYFWDGQPSINWLDPSFAGMRLVIGDTLHSLGEIGTKGLRLDANGFLGVEVGEEGTPAWSEGHPLSITANQIIASMVRKLGGFTFQELNLSMDDIKICSESGADLSYDFVNRPAYQHALAMGETEFLRLAMREARELHIDPASLIHALQNHDELTYELVHFWTVHNNDEYEFRGQKMIGWDIRQMVQNDLREKLVNSTPYNMLFTENGIACTTASMIAAICGYKEIDDLSSEQIERIKKMHLLLAKFNAWQPGVFALSGWDLAGALSLPQDSVKDLIKDGDTRWINRGAYDLIDSNPEAVESATGMPKTISLYGSLQSQLQKVDSFASQLKRILEVREKYEIQTSTQLDIPTVDNPAVLVLVHELNDSQKQVTVLNFSGEKITTRVYSESFVADQRVRDMQTDEEVGFISDGKWFSVGLDGYDGKTYLVDWS